MKIFKTDISEKKEFRFDGDTLKQVECVDPEKRIYIYERRHSDGHLFAYEVVRGKKSKNPDGNIVYTYPSSEDFGKYGYFISRQLKSDIPMYIKKLQQKGQKGLPL